MKPTLIVSIVIVFILSACRENHSDLETKGPMSTIDSLLLLQDELPPTAGFLKVFKGKFANDKEVELLLIKWEDGYLSGRYWYSGSHRTIELNGEAITDNNFTIYEGSFGNETGVFEAELSDSVTLRGIWRSTTKAIQVPFELKEKSPANDSIGWSGNWYFNEVWDHGILMIGNVTEKTLDFALSITRGGHQGSIDGIAQIKGRKAIFRTTEFDDSPCQLTLQFLTDQIDVEQIGANFSCGFGARAFAGGRYERIYKMKKANLGIGVQPSDVFPSPGIHDAFLKLVGKEAYHLFGFNMQRTEIVPIVDNDKPGATAIAGFIPGLNALNEAIIMYTHTGKIWAATIFYDRNHSEYLLLYYTNDPSHKSNLPVTIDSWRDAFRNYRVIF